MKFWISLSLLCITLTVILTTYTTFNIYNGSNERVMFPQPLPLRLSYHFPVGVTELKQCQRAFSLFTEKGTEKPIYNEFNYTVALVTIDAKAGILLHVLETRRGAPTGGGSSFLAVSDNNRKQLCFYEDFFNGGYAIWCPPPAPGRCTHVRVELKYANFTAYTIGYFPLVGRRLWHGTVCWNETIRRVASPGHGLPPALGPPWKKTDVEAPYTCRIDWFRDGGDWEVMNDNGVKIPLLDSDEFCRRVRSFRRIVMIGASHMRYKFNYLALTCANTLGPKKRKHGSARVNGTIYIRNAHMNGIADLWTKNLDPMNLALDDAIVIKHGAHDMYLNGTNDTLSISLPKYIYHLKSIQRHIERLGFRLVVVTSPPFGDKVPRTPIDERNNFSLAALARLLHTQLTPARVDVFDEFAVLLPLYDSDAKPCGGHYLCPNRQADIVRGHSGIVALHLLVRHLASELDTTTC